MLLFLLVIGKKEKLGRGSTVAQGDELMLTDSFNEHCFWRLECFAFHLAD